ncbi:MAG: hypothetical protein ACLUN5_05840 [Oscillospiraceae bacterium]
MVDCHIHMVLDGVNWKDAIARHKAAPQEALIRQTLGHYQALGFSYLRDGGDRWGVCDLAAKLAPEYGIRYRSPGFPIYKTGHYGSFIGRGFDGLAEYRALVREAKTRGAHFIKLMISGLMDFSQYGVLTGEPLPPDLIQDMIACAHDEGFSVMAHANGDEAVRAALAGGVDSIEHGAYLTDETLCQLAEVWRCLGADARDDRQSHRLRPFSGYGFNAAAGLSDERRKKSRRAGCKNCLRQRRGRVPRPARAGRSGRAHAPAPRYWRGCRHRNRRGKRRNYGAVLNLNLKKYLFLHLFIVPALDIIRVS